jgi:anti-anti-sigma factor
MTIDNEDQHPDSSAGRYRVVTTRGELGPATAAVLRFDLDGWGSRDGVQHVVVDLAKVTLMDTSALRILCTAHGRADREGGWLRLVYSSHGIGALLAATHLDARFPHYATVTDALAGRTSPPPLLGSSDASSCHRPTVRSRRRADGSAVD